MRGGNKPNNKQLGARVEESSAPRWSALYSVIIRSSSDSQEQREGGPVPAYGQAVLPSRHVSGMGDGNLRVENDVVEVREMI